MKRKAIQIPKKKKDEIDKLKTLFKQYSVIGIVDVTGLSSAQFQRLRKLLRKDVYIYLAKKRLIKLAIDSLDIKGLDKLKEHLNGIPVLVFTQENPFRMAKLFDKNKSNTTARPGQIAPKDIIVPAGLTPFVPGPIIGELGAAGLKTEVKEGKLHIRSDTVIVREGEEIKQKVAEVLTRLGIEPMEVGFNLIVVFENGTIYLKDVLSIDDKKVLSDLIQLVQESMNLSVYIGYITKDNIELLLRKAAIEINAIEPLIKIDLIKEKPKEEIKEKGIEKSITKVEEPKIKEEKIEEVKKEEIKQEPPKIEHKEEIIEKVKKGKEDKLTELKAGPTDEDIEKTEQFVKDLIDGKIKPGDTIDIVKLPEKKKKGKKDKKKEEEQFKEEEKIAQDILKKI